MNHAFKQSNKNINTEIGKHTEIICNLSSNLLIPSPFFFMKSQFLRTILSKLVCHMQKHHKLNLNKEINNEGNSYLFLIFINVWI